MGPRAGLDVTVKRKISSPCRQSNPGRPALGSSLYRLSHPTPNFPFSQSISQRQIPILVLLILMDIWNINIQMGLDEGRREVGNRNTVSQIPRNL
jgi:hypothetical protein